MGGFITCKLTQKSHDRQADAHIIIFSFARITVIAGVACAVMLFSPVVPLPLADTLEDVYPAVINIMACRLFRRTKSGAIRESEISSSVANQKIHVGSMQFAFGPGSSTETESKEEVHSL